MKILMLTLYLPYPPNSGGQIRSYNLIKHLSKKHDITLVSFIKKGEEKYASEMKKYCKEVIFFYRSEKPFNFRNIIKTGFSLYPFLVMRNLSNEAQIFLAKKLNKEKFDVIHVETFYLRPHIPADTPIPVVLVDQTIEYAVYQHYVSNLKWWFLKPLFYIDVVKLKYWETRFWKEAKRVIAVSEADKKTMQKSVPGLKVDIIPNAPGDDLANLYNPEKKPAVKNPLIFYQSNFLWMQNVEGAVFLAKEVFPLIRKVYPDARCRIIGQNARTNAHFKVNELESEGVEVIEQDKSDVEAVVRSYDEGTIFVAPLHGPGGTRLKILGAMSAGVPVVTTPVGASGLEVTNGENILIGETPKEIAELVIRLIKDKKLFKKIVENAKNLIKERYDWKAIAIDLSKIYESAKT
ncbi:MAG: glycosyltransferase family 4 protein [Patescibacteria group bacterium]